jgi:hypothetical protein
MNLYFELGLVSLLLTGRAANLNAENNPVMVDLLRSMGLDYVVDQDNNDENSAKERMIRVVGAIENRLAYYDGSELLVNWLVNQYLGELLADVQNGSYTPERNVAMQVCALGNKNSENMSGNAVNEWIEWAHKRLQFFIDLYEGHEQPNLAVIQAQIRTIEYAEKVLNIVDVFVTSRLGMLAGVEEFAPSQLEELPEPPEPDFELPEGCQQNADCACGCVADGTIALIQGMEDYLNGVDSYASRYLIGAASARDVRMSAVEGTEGAILDGIKDMAMKAWSMITESFNAISEWFSSSDDSGAAKAVGETAEANKKDLAAAKEGSGDQINPTAKAGLVKLAAESDPSGEFSTIVGGLNTKADASACLDKLMGLLQKQSGNASTLDKALADAKKKLADLKTAASGVTGKDEKNKEVVSTAKKATTEATAAAKEAVKTVKDQVTKHKKLVSGIRKAVQGISTKIFPAAEPKEAKDDKAAKKE